MRCPGLLARSALVSFAAAGALGVSAQEARPARLSTPPASVDLLLEARSQIDGPQASNRSGVATTVADVNGDGRSDVVVSTTFRTFQVVFGDPPSLVDLATFAQGFTITGSSLDYRVANAGDVNGDGRDDLLLTADSVDRAYVVFGRAETTPVDIDNLGAGGYTVLLTPNGVLPAVAGVGDVNGDGLGDVMIGDDQTAVHVVFGQASTTTLDVSALGSAGYAITIPALSGGIQVFALAGAGDVNGDGRADLLIGSSNARSTAGQAWVVFGKANTIPVAVDALGSAGYAIRGAFEGDLLGSAVANAGDANGDGVPDQIVGAVGVGDALSGAAYVVFGSRTSTATVKARALGARGYAISGAGANEHVGEAVAGGVDLDGDGRDDQVIGAPASGEGGRTSAGAAYVVYGRRSPGSGVVHLESYKRGYRIDGPATATFAGSAVVLPPRRVGQPQVVVNAPLADANGRTDSGSTYAVGSAPVARPPVDQVALDRSDDDSGPVIAGGGTPFALRYRVQRRTRIVATVLQVVSGRRTSGVASRCRVGAAAPKKGRRCVIHRRLQRLERVHARNGIVAVPLPKALRPGRYVVRLVAIDAGRRRFGPFRTTIVVTGRR